jgi:hypothetical protein
MASQGGCVGLGGGHIGGRGSRDERNDQAALETPAERRARTVHRPLRGGEETRSAQVHQPQRDLAAVACSIRALRHGSFVLAPSPPLSDPASSSSDDEAEEGRLIGLEDFIKDEAEEARALSDALAQTVEAAVREQTAEEADRRAMLRAIEAFQAREAARAQRMAEISHVQALKDSLDVSSGESSAECDLLGHHVF